VEQFLLNNIPAVLLGSMCVAFTAGTGVAGLLVVRRRVPATTLASQNEVAGVLIAIVGGLYGVLLAFVVAIAWQKFEDASALADQEAVLVLSMYRDALFFPAHTADLRNEIEAYARSVVDHEWEAMSTPAREAKETDAAMLAFVREVASIDPANDRESAFLGQYAARLDDLEDSRRSRLFAAETQLPGTLWFVLLFGGLITTMFTYFFGLPSPRAHMAMVAAIAATIGITLFLILSLDLPFTGDVAVEPSSMERAVREFADLRAG